MYVNYNIHKEKLKPLDLNMEIEIDMKLNNMVYVCTNSNCNESKIA